ncbi:MAG: hypothetical protein IPK79_01955 [Vampirovibrionales bacterium]|nr:hypothetical protein [Vampirovibrionales bacterium]
MKIILIHGIGNYNPGWSAEMKAAQILGVPKSDIIEFNYEDLMEDNWANKILVLAARLAASYYATPVAGFAANYIQDYADDILMYFVVPGIRKKIMNRFVNTLQENPKALVIGFSLGSIVAYETIKNFPKASKPTLITIGSALGSPPLKALVRQFLKVPDKSRPNVKNWYNVYSTVDVLSGKITDLGCNSKDQFKAKSMHKMSTYLKHVKRLLPQFF